VHIHVPSARSLRRPSVHGLPIAVLLAAALLSGCGSEAPTETPQAEVVGGAVGPDAQVSNDVKVLGVHLEYPLDGVYEPGEDASLYLGISNTGADPDVLVGVTGPDFADARTSGAGDGAGLAITVPAGGNVYVGAEGAPALTLIDLDRTLRSSDSTPVTFTFQRAGTVTVNAMVAAEGQDPRATVDFTRPAQRSSGDR
jgi:periplasmic copper chaperone A